jgi:uncharacterized protein (DUF1800 family)
MSTSPSAAPPLSDEQLERATKDPEEVDPGSDRARSRRSFFFFGAMAAAAILPGTAGAQIRSRVRRPAQRTEPTEPTEEFRTVRVDERPAAFNEWSTDIVSTSRLVRRVTMGVTSADVAKATQMGWQGYLNWQLNHTRINDDACESVVAQRWPLVLQTADQLSTADQGQVRTQLQESTIYRSAYSQRQLYQRMVEFWTDHFNQDFDKVQFLYVGDLRDVIRKHALGKFPDMVRASAHSPSMMLYLDQNVSRNTAPNQNYARELLELHTLGVDNGYTQQDVAELSRVLTGWTITGRAGTFTFNPAIHDRAAKTVMGITIPAAPSTQGAAGISEGESIIDMLVNHPNTARYISFKMLSWLLDPAPTQAQIDTVTSVYLATGGDIKAMIRVILNDTWLPSAPMKLKRPYHFMVSALRSATPNIVSLSPTNGYLVNLGQQLFAWDTPDGYPDKVEYWAGNIVPRWNFGSQFSSLNSTTTMAVDIAPYRAGTPAAAIDLIDQNFFGGEMPMVTRNALLAYAGTTALTDARARELLSLAISSNAFQWY